MQIVIVSGGFDPLHSGHIDYLKAAADLGDYLVVGINSDDWLNKKKGRFFMPQSERMYIISELSCVDEVLDFDDADNSACDLIQQTIQKFPNEFYIFANGGDRNDKNIPEQQMFHPRLSFEYGVGGTNKKNSSSWILDEWKTQKTERDWGYWRVLDNKPSKGYKVKELVIYPGKSLSDQRHFNRSEEWIVLEGIVQMETEFNERKENVFLHPHTKPYKIAKEVWHKASNPNGENSHILEIQWGDCYEEDIERR